jgi:hypothetical protein
VNFACPKCECDLEADADQSGSTVPCPNCGELISVPINGRKKIILHATRPPPAPTDPVLDTLSKLLRATSDLAGDVRQIRNAISMAMILPAVVLLLWVIGRVFLTYVFAH